MPLYTYNRGGGDMIMRRQCTHQYKIRPIRRKVRELAGMAPGRRYPGRYVETWQGISYDELARIGSSREAWEWRRYTGANGHTHHVHLSVKSDKANYDSAAPWAI